MIVTGVRRQHPRAVGPGRRDDISADPDTRRPPDQVDVHPALGHAQPVGGTIDLDEVGHQRAAYKPHMHVHPIRCEIGPIDDLHVDGAAAPAGSDGVGTVASRWPVPRRPSDGP